MSKVHKAGIPIPGLQDCYAGPSGRSGISGETCDVGEWGPDAPLAALRIDGIPK